MDPFSSFDLFRRRVDQMFTDFDQQMFGPALQDPFLDAPFAQQQKQITSSSNPKEAGVPSEVGHEKSTTIAAPSGKEEERIIPHQPQSSGSHPPSSSSSQRGLTTRPSGSSNVGLFNWPAPTVLPSMKLDVVEEKDRYLIHADVPGFSKDQLHLDIDNGVLTVRGETSSNKEEQDPERKYHRVERSSGSVFRSMRLPEGIKEDQVSATCENGVLNVVLPKMENVQKKKERKIRVE